MNFKEKAISINKELIRIRRELHKYPELGMEEVKTSQFIKDFLKNEKIQYKEVARTGVCAIIKGNKRGEENRTIALRADIDGLPMQDKKNCNYSSKIEGRMHACGHDAHTTILLSSAKLLNENRDLFSGNVKFLFEPAEETIGGARFMIEEGVLENPRVDCICGLHVEETIEVGSIMIKDDVVNAASNPFTITIKGYGAHGAYPHTSIDPIVIASHIVLALQTIVSREIAPSNAAVITVGSIHGGTAQNIIPDEVKISGIIRTMSKEDRNFAKKRLTEIVEGICLASRATCEIDIEESYPNLYNNSEMVALLKDAAKDVLEQNQILNQKNPKLGVESFAYFANERPSVFYFLGSGNKEKNITHPAHSSLFDIDEECLEIGVAIQCEMVLKYLTISENDINL